MVPILNHSLFIKMNNIITSVIIDIVIDVELDIVILLWFNSESFLCEGFAEPSATASSSDPKVSATNMEFNLYSGV